MTRGALPRPPSACSAARDAAPSAELWFGVMAPEGMKSPPGVDDGRGDPVHGGTIDAMMMSSLWLSKSWASETCGADFHVDCLYDYAFDNWRLVVATEAQGYFGAWRHENREARGWARLDLTAPFYTSSMAGLVKVAEQERDMWRVFAPFSGFLWFVAGLTVAIIALLFNLVFTLDAIRPPPCTRRGGEHAADEPPTTSSGGSVSLVMTPQPGAPRNSTRPSRHLPAPYALWLRPTHTAPRARRLIRLGGRRRRTLRRARGRPGPRRTPRWQG